MKNPDLFCVIMAGGVGSRFWPVSRKNKPKQFLDFFNTGKTLIQQTIERFLNICEIKNIYIVTNEMYKYLILEQIPEISEQQILCEPEGKNTAPCIAYANWKIQSINPNAVVVVSPADHLILNSEKFITVIQNAISFSESKKCIVTLGINPNTPNTGYGYIESIKNMKEDIPVKVNKFKEKPDLKTAKKYIKSQKYSWNSGVFIWGIKTIQNEFKKHCNSIYSQFEKIQSSINTSDEITSINKIYPTLEEISIDYAILEKSNHIYVIKSEFGWFDLGTWSSIHEQSAKDSHNNSVKGEHIVLYDTKNSMIQIEGDKTTVIQGLDNYIVIDTNDVLMIIHKLEEQKIKEIRKHINETHSHKV